MARAGLFLLDCVIYWTVFYVLVQCSLSAFFPILLKGRLGDIYRCISAFLFFSTSWQPFRVCHHCFHSQMLASNWSAFHSHFPLFPYCHSVWCFFFLFFVSYWTEYSINPELFLNLQSGATFVLIISFVVGSKDTCGHCDKIHKSNPEETRMCPTRGGTYGQSQGLSLLVCLSPDVHFWWCSLTGSPCESLVCVGLCYWCTEPCKKKTAPRMLKWKIFHRSILLMFFSGAAKIRQGCAHGFICSPRV